MGRQYCLFIYTPIHPLLLSFSLSASLSLSLFPSSWTKSIFISEKESWIPLSADCLGISSTGSKLMKCIGREKKFMCRFQIGCNPNNWSYHRNYRPYLNSKRDCAILRFLHQKNVLLYIVAQFIIIVIITFLKK